MYFISWTTNEKKTRNQSIEKWSGCKYITNRMTRTDWTESVLLASAPGLRVLGEWVVLIFRIWVQVGG